MGEIKFINYGYADPSDSAMTVVCEVGGEYAGKYKGYFDGNIVKLYLKKRIREDAPYRATVAPEYMENRLGQALDPRYYG